MEGEYCGNEAASGAWKSLWPLFLSLSWKGIISRDVDHSTQGNASPLQSYIRKHNEFSVPLDSYKGKGRPLVGIGTLALIVLWKQGNLTMQGFPRHHVLTCLRSPKIPSHCCFRVQYTWVNISSGDICMDEYVCIHKVSAVSFSEIQFALWE